MHKLILFFISLALAFSCASQKQLSGHIDAYEETMHTIESLKKKPSKEKLWVRINRSYPDAMAWFDAEIDSEKTGSLSKVKWTNTYTQMIRANAMTDSVMQIKGWENHISGLRKYDSELDSAKTKAVNECIQQAEFLNKYSNRATLKIALFYLNQAESIDPEKAEIETLRKEISEKLNTLPPKE